MQKFTFRTYHEKYKHIIPLLVYAVIYLTWFIWVEQKTIKNYTIIHVTLDDYIPFCEWFIIPYFLWFLYVSSAVLWCFFKDKDGYFRACIFLFTGMTIFLIISTLFPNGQHLRPQVMPRDNMLTAWVSYLYSTDTPTNIWPSIHVYNSLGAHFVISKTPKLGSNRWIRTVSFILCISIILSTMFLKQHSVFDVVTAFIMAAIMYGITYKYDILTAYRERFHTDDKATPQVN